MTNLESLAELTKECGLNASVEITTFGIDNAVLIKPTDAMQPKAIFTLLEPLCKEISFAVPSVRYAIVKFGEAQTIVDCSQYQR